MVIINSNGEILQLPPGSVIKVGNIHEPCDGYLVEGDRGYPVNKCGDGWLIEEIRE